MSQDCCQPTVTTMILACSGGSNVGQLSNQAAIELTQEGFGKLSCLAGVGAHLSGFVQSARDIDALVVIDGCEVGCAKKVLEHGEVPLRAYLVITALGIDKNKDMNLKRDEIDRVKAAVRRLQPNSGEQAQPVAQATAACGCRQT
ncbi:MAG: putative zinc-binding protein [Desulfobaccales bacterium]